MFEGLTPRFLDEDAASDAQAYNLAPSCFSFPFKSELAVALGVFSQFALACRNIVISPLLLFRKGVSSNTRSYSFYMTSAILLSFIFLSYMNIDMDLMISWLSTQKYYKLWAYYTIMYVTSKYIPKMHNFMHSQIRGTIRAGKGIRPLTILLITIGASLLYMHQLLYIGTFVAGKGKDKTFFSTVLHNQFIYYKKFVPKATEGNPFITESLNRIIAIFAFFYILEADGFCTKLLMLVGFEYGCAFIRFFFISVTDDGENFLEKMRKLARESILFLAGKQNVPTNESVYLTSSHEGITLLLLFLLKRGSIVFKLTLLAAIVLLALYSVTFGKDLMRLNSVTSSVFSLSQIDFIGSNSNTEKKKESEESPQLEKLDSFSDITTVPTIKVNDDGVILDEKEEEDKENEGKVEEK